MLHLPLTRSNPLSHVQRPSVPTFFPTFFYPQFQAVEKKPSENLKTTGLLRKSLSSGDISSHRPGQDTGEQKKSERMGKSKKDIGKCCSKCAQQHNRTTTDAIGERAPKWRKDQLHQRIDTVQKSNAHSVHAKFLTVEGEQRKNDSKTQQVDHHHQEDGGKAWSACFHILFLRNNFSFNPPDPY